MINEYFISPCIIANYIICNKKNNCMTVILIRTITSLYLYYKKKIFLSLFTLYIVLIRRFFPRVFQTAIPTYPSASQNPTTGADIRRRRIRLTPRHRSAEVMPRIPMRSDRTRHRWTRLLRLVSCTFYYFFSRIIYKICNM